MNFVKLSKEHYYKDFSNKETKYAVKERYVNLENAADISFYENFGTTEEKYTIPLYTIPFNIKIIYNSGEFTSLDYRHDEKGKFLNDKKIILENIEANKLKKRIEELENENRELIRKNMLLTDD